MYHDKGRSGRIMGRLEALRRFPELNEELWRRADSLFPVRITRSWAERIQDASDPLARQALPQATELVADPGDLEDPVGDRLRRPVPWVVQKHPDRVLLLMTRRCHLYCRYCFRRDDPGPEDPSPIELARALEYVRNSGARELILSGGDPLAVSDARLFSVLDTVRGAVGHVRIHTRAPITAPFRVSAELVEGLRQRGPIWVLVHCNHPDELSADTRAALARLSEAGIPLLCQSVLLAGVNDDLETLVRLSEALLACKVFPYYLHHPDPVPGNAAFRLGMDRGLELHRALARRVSGIGLPRYVVDPPDGLGKIEVAEWVRAGGRPAVE